MSERHAVGPADLILTVGFVPWCTVSAPAYCTQPVVLWATLCYDNCGGVHHLCPHKSPAHPACFAHPNSEHPSAARYVVGLCEEHGALVRDWCSLETMTNFRPEDGDVQPDTNAFSPDRFSP